MYRNCIYCAGDLGANDALEWFPVGRMVAFDGEKGRLWAVCMRCARWNLAPIEERWEALEAAERLFRGTRTRVQHENVGVAKLGGGTRLVRIGEVVPGELVAWRYGETMERRWRRTNRWALTGVALAMGAGVPAAAVGTGAVAGIAAIALGGAAVAGLLASVGLIVDLSMGVGDSRIVHLARVDGGEPVPLRGGQLALARLRRGLSLEVPSEVRSGRGKASSGDVSPPLVLRGNDAVAALGRALALVNLRGGTRAEVARAHEAIERAGSPRRLLMSVARRGPLLTGAMVPPHTRYATSDDKAPDPQTMLAVEMALHAESERRAIEGELAGLIEMWRQAEEIAAIADNLPDLLRRVVRLPRADRHPPASG